jgi:translation initiation factor IF-3
MNFKKKEKETPNRINHDIIGVAQVRLVGDNVEQGIYSFRDAYKLADEMELDLVEISRNSDPPVCKIIDYQKYLYQQKKAQKERAANSQQQEIKEVRFTPNIGDNDYQTKLNQSREFLNKGDKVKASIFFKGREIAYKDQGELLLANFCNDLEEYGVPEKVPTLEGKRMYVTIKPKKK